MPRSQGLPPQAPPSASGLTHFDQGGAARMVDVGPKAETERLARLAQDLADSAQVVAGRFRIRTTQCDLVEIAREQVELGVPLDKLHVFDPETEKSLI